MQYREYSESLIQILLRLEKEMSVKIVNRNEGIKIVGEEAEVAKAERIVKTMVSLIRKG